MRTRIEDALKDAMLAEDTTRKSTLRLILAAIKERDIALRSEGAEVRCSEDDMRALLAKMIKQRHESARIYEESGRLGLAEQERAEIEIIKEFLPKPLSENEVQNAVSDAIAKTGAASLRDMGRVMASLKAEFSGRIDFGKVGPMVKDHLSVG